MRKHFLLPTSIKINFAKEELKKVGYSYVRENTYLFSFEPENYTHTRYHSNDCTIKNVLQVIEDEGYLAVWDFNCLGISIDEFKEVLDIIEKRKIEVQIINPPFKFTLKDAEFNKWYLASSIVVRNPRRDSIICITKKNEIKKLRPAPRMNVIKRMTQEQKSNIRMDKRQGMRAVDVLKKYDINLYTYNRLTKDIKGVNRLAEYNELTNNKKRAKKSKVKISGYFSSLNDDNIFVILNKYLSSKLTHNTRMHYQAYLAKLYQFVDAKNKTSLTKDKLYVSSQRINELIEHMKKEKFERNTIALYFRVYRNWFNYLFAKNLIHDNPMVDVCKPPKDRSFCTTGHLEKDELKKVFELIVADIESLEAKEATEQELFVIKRDFTLFYLMANTGLRSGSCLKITKNDILKFDKYHISVSMKGGYNQKVFLQPNVLKVFNCFVKEYSEYSPANFFIFRKGIKDNCEIPVTNTIKYLKHVFKRLNIYIEARLHVFRVTFAVHCHQNGMSLVAIRDKLYHSDVSVTSKYIKRVDEFENSNLIPNVEIFNPELLLKRKNKNTETSCSV